MRMVLPALALAIAAPASARPGGAASGPIAAAGVDTVQEAVAALAARERPPEPARLAAARMVMAKLFPPGTYRTLMSGSMSQMMGGMTRQMMDLPINQLAGMAGVPKGDLERMGPATLHQVMAILDPAFERRTTISTKVMLDQIVELLVRYEPEIREGYAQAYAYRMTAAQLDDLDRFLQTPSGRAYAANAIPSFADPAVVQKMQMLMPEIVKAMPAIIGKVQAATADLPKPKRPDELSDADREALARLMGVDPAKLKPTAKKEPTS